jgi:hypothetical protein
MMRTLPKPHLIGILAQKLKPNLSRRLPFGLPLPQFQIIISLELSRPEQNEAKIFFCSTTLTDGT